MASEPILDFDRLLSPISEDSPSGSYLRHSDFERFQQVKDARSAAMTAERKIREFAMIDEDELSSLNDQGQGVEVPSAPDWRSVQDQCIETIAEHSKDLWVATWLIEALARRSGFAGVRDGCKLVTELADRFWDGIYPPKDEDDGYLDTVSQIASLNGLDGAGTLISPLEEIPLIPGFSDLTYAAYRQATERGGGDVTEGDFENAVRQVEIDALRDQEEDLSAVLDTYLEMCEQLETKCREGEDDENAPPSSQVRATLETIQHAFSHLTRNVLASDSLGEQDSDDEESNEITKVSGGPAVDIAQAQVNSREDAFKMLIKASEFFRKTEPHSPVSYMLQQTVEFGRMDLPQLLQTLIGDEDVLKDFSKRVGVPVQDDDDDDD